MKKLYEKVRKHISEETTDGSKLELFSDGLLYGLKLLATFMPVNLKAVHSKKINKNLLIKKVKTFIKSYEQDLAGLKKEWTVLKKQDVSLKKTIKFQSKIKFQLLKHAKEGNKLLHDLNVLHLTSKKSDKQIIFLKRKLQPPL